MSLESIQSLEKGNAFHEASSRHHYLMPTKASVNWFTVVCGPFDPLQLMGGGSTLVSSGKADVAVMRKVLGGQTHTSGCPSCFDITCSVVLR